MLLEEVEQEIDGLSIQNIDVPVDIRPLWYDTHDQGQNISPYSAVITHPNTDMEKVVFAGKRYQLIPNTELIKTVETLQDNGFSLVNAKNIDNKSFEVRMINPAKELQIGKELAYLQCSLHNSYDGSQSFRAIFGCYVQVCTNGAILGDKFAIKVKHIKRNDSNYFFKFDINEFVTETILGIDGAMDKMQNKEFNRTKDEVKTLAESFVKGIPMFPDKPNPVKMVLNDLYARNYDKYKNHEFALFMAVTDIAYNQKAGIGRSYQELFKQRTKLFFN